MKRLFLLATFVCAALFSSCEGYDDSELVNRLNDFETRLKQLEETCKQLNANISSLQTIVNAIQKNDQISTVAPISKDGKEIGYSIVFTSGKSITIYHGTDGQNGQNGSDGQNGQDGADGYTPVIGVKMDADGIYYWTVDGEWLTDENGNKIQASPSEGNNGSDGADGEDGKDGVTPQLKIENEYWFVSYDNGQTWTKLGKATGAQGDSFFQSVTQDSNNVYFKLADGTTITIPKSSGAQSIALTYIPRYSDGKATVFYSSKSDSYVELDFEVSPASAAANWRDAATVKAVYTETRAGVQMVDMAILSWTVDINAGTITVKASGANLSDAFFAGTQEASARLAIDDDNLNLLSDYIPMVAKNTNAQPEPTTQPDNEIWYTSNDNNIVIPFNEAQTYGAYIVSNTYEDGKGVIKFDAPVAQIGVDAFSDCKNLKEITLPNSVTSIGEYAFYNCSSLTGITIPNSVTSIGEYAFSDCISLAQITIPNSVTEISKGMFNGCTSLINVNIPNTLTTIKGAAFKGCSSLQQINLPNNIVMLDDEAFEDCSSLASIAIPAGVTVIGYEVFRNCGSLTSVLLHKDVTEIRWRAFSACSSLTTITIPNSVTVIESQAFAGCENLAEINIPNGVTEIGNLTFSNCSNLTNVTIPNSVTRIGAYAFYSCSSLAEITIPNSVTEIGSTAFNACSSLQNIICKPTTPPMGGSLMFDGIHSSAKIYVPTGSGDAYKAKQYWSDYADIIEEKEM